MNTHKRRITDLVLVTVLDRSYYRLSTYVHATPAALVAGLADRNHINRSHSNRVISDVYKFYVRLR
jgi:hypothetical protein